VKIQKRHIVLAALVLALGSAVYLNWQFQDVSKLSADTSKELGAATYVNANSTDDEATQVAKQTTTSEQYFSKAIVERQQSRDEAVEIATKAVESSDSSDDAKTRAVEQLSKIEDTIIKESNIESLVKAKGFSNCLCIVSDKSCTVSVPKKELKKNSPLIIKDVVLSQLEIEFSKIVIVEV